MADIHHPEHPHHVDHSNKHEPHDAAHHHDQHSTHHEHPHGEAAGHKSEHAEHKTGKKGKPEVKLLIGEEAKMVYSQRIMRALTPIRIFGACVGQFPFSRKQNKNGTYTFRFSWYTLSAWYFAIMMFISFYTLIFGGWNLFMTITDAHEFKPTALQVEERWFEKSLLHRNLIWVISIFAAVIQSCVSYLFIYQNRHYLPSVLSFYTRLVQQLHMDISDSAFSVTLTLIVIYLVTFTAIIIMGFTRFAPVAVGAPTLLGIYMFRFFLLGNGFWIETDTVDRRSLQSFGAVFLILVFTASKIQMIIFVYHCKLLRNAFACWNGRAYVALMKGGKYFFTQEGKLTFKLLYKDHNVILDIMEATNRLCAGTMEVYYGLQTATIFFEVYFVFRSARYGDDKNTAAQNGGLFFMRPNDWIPGVLLAFQSIVFAMYTAKVAIDVGQEAMAGLDIVRRKMMLHRKTDDELLFQLSMQASFSKPFDICGGGYQYINTDWILGYINNVAGYFIILYQFQPAMDRSTKKEWEHRESLGIFLANLEGLPADHYKSTVPPPAILYGLP